MKVGGKESLRTDWNYVSLCHCFPASKEGDLQGRLMPFTVAVRTHLAQDAGQLRQVVLWG